MAETGKNNQSKALLSNDEVFNILKDAQVKYEKFLEVSKYVVEDTTNVYEPVKRDINNPLTISMK